MAENPYGLSGMRNTPMFIGWEPFGMDFSPFWKAEALMAQGQRQRGSPKGKEDDLKMGGLSPDQMEDYMAKSAIESAMTERTKGKNPAWVARNDPEFQRLQQQRQLLVGSVGQQRRKEDEDDFNAYRAMRTKWDPEGAANFFFTDAKGVPQVDPDTGQFVEQETAEKLRLESGWLTDQVRARNMRMSGTQMTSPGELDKRLFDAFGKAGAHHNLSDSSRYDSAQLAQMAENDKDPMLAGMAAVIYNKKHKTNSTQLHRALTAMSTSLDAGGRTAILNAYKETPDYFKGISKEADGGGFLLDEKGNASPQKLFERVFGTPSGKLEGLLVGQDKERFGKMSYDQFYLYDRMEMFLSAENTGDPKLMRLKPLGDGAGATGKYEHLWYRITQGPETEKNPYTGQTSLVNPIKQTLTVAHEKYGPLQINVEGARDPMTQQEGYNTRKKVGVIDNSGKKQDVPWDGSIFDGKKVLLAGGRHVDLSRGGWMISDVEQAVYSLPKGVEKDIDTDPQAAKAWGVEFKDATYRSDAPTSKYTLSGAMTQVVPHRKTSWDGKDHQAFVKVFLKRDSEWWGTDAEVLENAQSYLPSGPVSTEDGKLVSPMELVSIGDARYTSTHRIKTSRFPGPFNRLADINEGFWAFVPVEPSFGVQHGRALSPGELEPGMGLMQAGDGSMLPGSESYERAAGASTRP